MNQNEQWNNEEIELNKLKKSSKFKTEESNFSAMIIAIISTITILIELIKVIKILCTKIAKRNAAYNEMKRIRETTNTET